MGGGFYCASLSTCLAIASSGFLVSHIPGMANPAPRTPCSGACVAVCHSPERPTQPSAPRVRVRASGLPFFIPLAGSAPLLPSCAPTGAACLCGMVVAAPAGGTGIESLPHV